MRDRRYGVDSRGRSPSPRRRPWPISRDFSPSRHRKLAPYHRHEKEEYSQEARTSRRIEERGYMDRDYNFRGSRLSELDNRHRNRDRDMDMDRDRGRDENVVGSRGYRSPRGIEKRDDFDRPLKSSNYGDLFKGKYENGTSFDHSKRSYAEDSYNGDGSSTKFQYDRLLGGPVNSDYLSSKNGTFARDSRGIGDPDITRGGERDYYSQDRYLDSGRAQVLSVPQYLDGAKPAPTEYESGRMYSRSYSLADGGVRDIPVRNCSGGDGGSHMLSVASRYLNIDADKQKYYETCDEPHLARRDVEDNYVGKKNYGYHFQDKFLGTGKSEREIHKLSEEDNILSSRGYLKGDSDYMLPSSRSKAYDTKPLDVLKEGMPGCSAHMMSDVIQRGTELSSLSTGFDPYNAKKQNVFSEGPRNQLDTQSSSELYTRLPEERQGDWSYVESGRRIKDNMSRLNEVEEDYRDLHTSGTGLLNRTIDERFPKSHMGDDVPHEYDQYPSYKVQLTHDIFDACDPLQVRNQDVDTLRTRSSHPNYVTEGYFRRGVKPEEHHADVDSGQWSRFERSDLISSRGYGPSYDKLIDSPREEMMPMTELSLDEHSERRLSEKHVSDKMLYEHDAGIRISTDGNGSRMIYNQVDAEDADYLYLSKKPKFGRHDYEKTWWLSSEMGNDQPSSSNALPRSSIIPHKSDSRNIKKRLGPIHQKLHVSHRIVDKYKPSVKKRLAAARPKKYAAPPWLKKKNSYIVASNQNGLDGDAQDHDGDHLGDHLHLEKSEPPEKSEEFKQLVQSAFFKFLKQINETPIKRKKYLEQGQASTIKCIVCGSNSDEFVGTESLAMHAFKSQKVGLRSQHLGLHKAICALMRWKIADEPSNEWHREVMTYAETSALKEDLIIWPPIVIVHNSTIDSRSPDERVVVSTEKLDTKLKDMGFGSILKVCNGKPANQSVMLVKFSGTLSGLQEAERLHQSYIQSKRGRAELEQFKSGKKVSWKGTASADEGDKFLYGHLGIAEDLDKLDFDTKKRCVLKSKKQILSIVIAPV